MSAASVMPTISRDRFGIMTRKIQWVASRRRRNFDAYNGAPSIGLLKFAYERPKNCLFFQFGDS
jgi:hypothetical protein